MIVAGAKAGIKQNGNSARNSTPWLPVSILNLVNNMAIADVNKISTRPKVFHAKVSFLA
jgi:hypothetical protein